MHLLVRQLVLLLQHDALAKDSLVLLLVILRGQLAPPPMDRFMSRVSQVEILTVKLIAAVMMLSSVSTTATVPGYGPNFLDLLLMIMRSLLALLPMDRFILRVQPQEICTGKPLAVITTTF